MKKRGLLGTLLLLLLLALAGCGAQPELDSTVKDGERLEVHIIDVGQADAILIKTPDAGNILIDGGTGSTEDALVKYLEKQGVKRLDYVIATHPHEDHIGGLDAAIKAFDVGAVYMPKVSHTTKAFENMLLAIKDKDIKTVEAKADVSLPLGSGTQALFLAPASSEYEELNNYSAVLKLVYGQTSFLFTGDAEKLSEEEMLERYSQKTLASTVLKVGHHGSKTSTSEAFLEAVHPKWGAISVGKDNDYGLPSDSTLKRLDAHGVSYWRTDEVGSIVFYSDGQTVTRGDESISAGQGKALLPSAETPAEAPTDADIAPAEAKAAVTIASVDRAAEIAVLTNSGSTEVNLSGWVLLSVKGDQRYTFPEGTILAAGASLSVVSGPDAAAGPNQLVWSTQNIWNNDHDPAQLYDANGVLQAAFGQ